MERAVDCDLLFYADDSCLIFRDKSIEQIEINLNRNFNMLCDWFLENRLSIHFGEDKTKSILFGRKNCNNLKKLDIRRGDIMIKQYSTVTYLGCFFYSIINIYNISLHLTIPTLITIQHYRYDTMGSERQ